MSNYNDIKNRVNIFGFSEVGDFQGLTEAALKTIYEQSPSAQAAMDVYNRGYGEGVEGLPASGGIGNATIETDALSDLNSSDVQSAGFYAIAYGMTGVAGFLAGETVMSRRPNYERPTL